MLTMMMKIRARLLNNDTDNGNWNEDNDNNEDYIFTVRKAEMMPHTSYKTMTRTTLL